MPRSRTIVFATLAVATAFVTLAIAQPKKGAPGAAKKPPATKDAGGPSADNPYEGTNLMPGADAGKLATGDAGKIEVAASVEAGAPVPPPSGAVTIGDGGARPSPLNPTPEEMPSAKLDAGASPIDYDKLIADIAALRARVSAVGDSMFRSRVAIAVSTEGDHGKIGRLTIALDDGVVYTAPSNFRADDLTQIFAGGVAAGRHAITVDVDRNDDRGDGFKTSQRSRFLVDVPRDQELAVDVRVSDDSNMAKDFPSGQEGKYELKVRLQAKARQPGKK